MRPRANSKQLRLGSGTRSLTVCSKSWRRLWAMELGALAMKFRLQGGHLPLEFKPQPSQKDFRFPCQRQTNGIPMFCSLTPSMRPWKEFGSSCKSEFFNCSLPVLGRKRFWGLARNCKETSGCAPSKSSSSESFSQSLASRSEEHGTPAQRKPPPDRRQNRWAIQDHRGGG